MPLDTVSGPLRPAVCRGLTMRSRTLKNIDWLLLFLLGGICVCGFFAIFSAAGGGRFALTLLQKQSAGALVGVLLLATAAALDDNFLPRISGWIYWLTALMLLIVDLVGRHSHGAQRWISIGPVDIQPSEPAKVAIIITLSVLLVRHYDQITELRTVLKSLAHVGLPLLLIFKQPDLGTSLVLGAIWLGVSLAAGVRGRHIAGVLIGVALLGVIAWHTGIIKDYQKDRLTSCFNPDADPRGSGYHIRQSRIAIGSGQVAGLGYRQGTQSQLNFIPEQHTDFIFTVVGEEFGFAGAAALVLAFWLLVGRVAGAMQSTEERLGRCLAGGVLAMLLFHIFVNIGMTLGIMPVTGVPLPLVSYGPSNLLSTMTALGLVVGVHARRHRIAF